MEAVSGTPLPGLEPVRCVRPVPDPRSRRRSPGALVSGTGAVTAGSAAPGMPATASIAVVARSTDSRTGSRLSRA